MEAVKRELEEAGVSIRLNLKLVDWNGSEAEFVDFEGKKENGDAVVIAKKNLYRIKKEPPR